MKAPKRILVIVTRRIGDVLLATPLIRSLKQAWPETSIDVLVFAGTQGVLHGNPDLDTIHAVAERPRLIAHLAFMARLFRSYDLAISLVTGDRSTLYAWFTGRHRLGLLLDETGQRWKQLLLHHWLPLDARHMHTVRAHLTLTTVLGIAPVPEVVPSWLPRDAATVVALLGDAGTPFAVLHPYPKFHYKLWHQQGWLEVARWLQKNGFRVALTGSPDTDELAYVTAIAQQLPDALNLAGQLTLGGIAALLARAKLYIGPDTAITHMAAASGIPTVALYGPSDPVKWGPWPQGHPVATNPWRRLGNQRSGNVQLIQGRAACVPCLLEGCGRRLDSTSDCLLAIPASAVVNAIKKFDLTH